MLKVIVFEKNSLFQGWKADDAADDEHDHEDDDDYYY